MATTEKPCGKRRKKEKPRPAFYCNICGLRSSSAILCTRDDCLTDITIKYSVSAKAQ